jgi:hypothetical protein
MEEEEPQVEPMDPPQSVRQEDPSQPGPAPEPME